MNSARYEERAKLHQNEVARTLLTLMAEKQTNLCVSVDLTDKAALLKLVDLVGPYVCVIKTHIDIVADFDEDLIVQLQQLSARHNFLFFEDRKFADIGNTVALQYAAGIYRIASWAHITNAHTVPGEGIIQGLKSVGLPLNRGLLLLAEMSSKGNLATGDYTQKTLQLASKHKDFVMGFIGMRRFPDLDGDFLILTPGVGLDATGDAMGQTYRTPDQVIYESGCDVIIVGRGIYAKMGKDDEAVKAEAKRYQEAGWQAYLKRVAA